MCNRGSFFLFVNLFTGSLKSGTSAFQDNHILSHLTDTINICLNTFKQQLAIYFYSPYSYKALS